MSKDLPCQDPPDPNQALHTPSGGIEHGEPGYFVNNNTTWYQTKTEKHPLK